MNSLQERDGLLKHIVKVEDKLKALQSPAYRPSQAVVEAITAIKDCLKTSFVLTYSDIQKDVTKLADILAKDLLAILQYMQNKVSRIKPFSKTNSLKT